MIETNRVEAVVIGGSAGAFAALKVLIPALPAELAVPVLVVIHLPPDRPSAIVEVFQRAALHRMKEADDKEPAVGGTVYFAPPAYHLLVETDRSLSLSSDDPVHHSRPSIDVLFESAADAFGAGLLAVVLSGASEDGARGLKAVVDAGGQAIVQAPDTAEHRLMPAAALRATSAHAVASIQEIAAIFSTLPQGHTHA
jgi:two-component system, chemotaxis family, protein-glutamate methylesterase/glutaminase